MTWGIGLGAGGTYTAIETEEANALVASPGGVPITSSSQALVELIAHGMNYFGDDVCSGMIPYGLESSWLDFQISHSNLSQVGALQSAYDEYDEEMRITREDWVELIDSCAPRNLAVLMCVCGSIGVPQVAYDVLTQFLAPPQTWNLDHCGIRGQAAGDVTRL